MKKVSISILAFLSVIASAQIRTPFDRYNADVIAAMGLTGVPSSTNAPTWFIPSNFVFGAISVSVKRVNPDVMLLDHPHRLLFSDGAEPVLCHAYPRLESNNVARVLGNAIGGPSNLPAEMFAAMFSVETNHTGFVVIEPQNGTTSRDFVVAIFNDAIVRVDTSATNRIELATAILRAGGVEIPDEPLPRNPEPELEP